VDAASRSRRAELLDAARLALVPIGVALLFGVLLLPRRAPPDDVPLPIADGAALDQAWAVDRALAAEARRTPLPGPVRALGSAIRQYHALEASQSAEALGRARTAVDRAMVEATQTGDGPLLQLRAVQLEGFLDEVRAFEAHGTESTELGELAGRFIAQMRSVGWCEQHTLLPSEAARRTMFKEMWNAFLGFAARPAFVPTLDEERALYAFYLAHPHPSASMQSAIEAAKRGAHDPASCLGVREAEQGATEAWRLERIGRLATIDPAYPEAFARGVASYRRADYRAAAAAFRAWVTAHPEGPLALRAQTFMRAAELEATE
jgi:hypothetical protein